MAERDLFTEAKGFAAVKLGWFAQEITVEDSQVSHIKILCSPTISRFALYVDLTLPYNPTCLLYLHALEENQAWERFNKGERTLPEKLKEILNVNKGHARGPVLL